MADPVRASEDLVSELVDLADLSLEVIAELPPSVLGIALRRAVETARQPDDVQSVGGYQQCVS